MKTFHQVFSTNEPREGRAEDNGLARGARSEAPISSPHQAPGASHQRRAQIPRDCGARREAARRACDGAARVAGPPRGLSNQGSDASALHSRSPVAVLGRGSHLVQKTNSHHTPLSQAPLATTSDLMQKHLTSFLNPWKRRSCLPEVTKKWRTDDEAEAPAAYGLSMPVCLRTAPKWENLEVGLRCPSQLLFPRVSDQCELLEGRDCAGFTLFSSTQQGTIYNKAQGLLSLGEYPSYPTVDWCFLRTETMS